MYSGKPKYVLDDEEIIKWLNRFKYDPEFQDKYGYRAVPLACFCDFAGVSRSSVYRFMKGDRSLSIWFKQRLSEAIAEVRRGLRWRRVKDHGYVMNNPQQQRFPRYDRVRRQA